MGSCLLILSGAGGLLPTCSAVTRAGEKRQEHPSCSLSHPSGARRLLATCSRMSKVNAPVFTWRVGE